MSSENKRTVVDLVKTSLTLFIIAAIVAIMLAVANNVTAPIIERSAQERLNQSLNELMTDASRFDSVDPALIDLDVPVLAVYKGYDQGEAEVGYCVHVAPNGYSDVIEMMVATDMEGAVKGVRILSISDTPGVGMKVESDEAFQNSVIGKSEVLTVVKGVPAAENEIQGISSATISSTGYVDGVNAAISVVQFLNASENGEVAE